MKIAGKKIAVTNDISTNKKNLILAIEQAANVNAEILLTPEGSLSGYTYKFDQKEVDDALAEVLSAAKKSNLGLALGTCFYEDDGKSPHLKGDLGGCSSSEKQKKCYNQLRFYLPTGEYLGFHSKVLRCGSWGNPPVGELNDFATTSLKVFKWNDELTIGGIICNDMWANPDCTPMPDVHLSQQLSKKGAKILFHAVNGGRNGDDWSKVIYQYHEANLRMRANAGKVWIVTVDNSFPTNLPSAAPSGVLSPDGNWALKAKDIGDDFFSYDIETQ